MQIEEKLKGIMINIRQKNVNRNNSNNDSNNANNISNFYSLNKAVKEKTKKKVQYPIGKVNKVL